MARLLIAWVSLFALAPTAGLADDSVPSGHSTLHIVFITPHSQQGVREFDGGQRSMVRVGNAIVPAADVRPIRITIDGGFVGHAMAGVWDVKPVFVLPEGNHKLKFELDGFDPVSTDIRVLGTKSKQYLLVKFPAESPILKQPAASVDAATGHSLND
ncbi:hypothetical protein [Crateriforma spongiae]|uniref:hypothetical protein n=1 Tax=Crateriforma spongiae TaxID=2724528 RepID=UPI00144517FC|nr:hypothetical protein [Crateriforma spongiae]